MDHITLVERDMSTEEYARVIEGFRAYGREHGNPREEAVRFGFVALDGDQLVGCSSSLVYTKAEGYSNWAYLTDLYVAKAYRRQGLGSRLLHQLETRIAALGVGNIYTYTAGYEAPAFYQKQGYTIFIEMDDWYTSGHSRVGLKKVLVL